ncbi:MAG: hypothetical protein EAZ08_00175 [Cytophagales bacterium]|nr:MAG: hypothetical protein EAZ08_00175 [Cytophagales bacterium]
MNKFLIVVEGHADVAFLKSYLSYLLDNNKDFVKIKTLSKSQQKKKQQKEGKEKNKDEDKKKIMVPERVFDTPIIDIFPLDGCTKLFEYHQDIIDIKNEAIDKEQNFHLLMIQDADNPKKHHGGVAARLEYLKAVKKQIEEKESITFDFETFLFPNHKDDGDLETLLMSIINQEEYNKFFACYQSYCCCIKPYANPSSIDSLLENKSKIFSYVQTHRGQEFANEGKRDYKDGLWNLDSEYLEPLKKFLLDKFIEFSH